MCQSYTVLYGYILLLNLTCADLTQWFYESVMIYFFKEKKWFRPHFTVQNNISLKKIDIHRTYYSLTISKF